MLILFIIFLDGQNTHLYHILLVQRHRGKIVQILLICSMSAVTLGKIKEIISKLQIVILLANQYAPENCLS